MKKYTIGLFLLLAVMGSVSAQKTKTARPVKTAAGLVLKNGDVLVYEVNNSGQAWHFEVTVKEIREALVFDWMMPEKDISGEITLEKQARESATAYINYFTDSTEQVLTDSSTVWMSRKNYQELKKGSTILSLDKQGAERFDKKESSSLGIIYKGKGINLKMFRATNGKTDGDAHELWILDQPAQPLILKMNLGWTIVLKEIKTLE